MHLCTSTCPDVKISAHCCSQAGCICKMHCLQLVMEHVQMVLIMRQCHVSSTGRMLQQNTTCVIVGCSICKADVPSSFRQITHSCYDSHDKNPITPAFVAVNVQPQGKIIDGFAVSGSANQSSLMQKRTHVCIEQML